MQLYARQNQGIIALSMRNLAPEFSLPCCTFSRKADERTRALSNHERRERDRISTPNSCKMQTAQYAHFGARGFEFCQPGLKTARFEPVHFDRIEVQAMDGLLRGLPQKFERAG